MQPIGVDQGMARGLDQLYVLHPGLTEGGGDKRGSAIHIRAILGQRADARNAQELFELFKQARLIQIDERVGGGGHGVSEWRDHYTAAAESGWWTMREQALNRMRRTSGS